MRVHNAIGFARQDEILQAIRQHITEHGHAPTIRELKERLGVASTSTVYHHLSTLKERGLVTWTKGHNRTLRLTEGGAA